MEMRQDHPAAPLLHAPSLQHHLAHIATAATRDSSLYEANAALALTPLLAARCSSWETILARNTPFYERPKPPEKQLGTLSFLPAFTDTATVYPSYQYVINSSTIAPTSQTNNVPVEMANLICLQ
jgi:hypothetical protein